jgi:hypothetical protein
MSKQLQLYPAGTILELGPLDDEPNAPNVKHTLVRATRLHPPFLIRGINFNHFRERPIISIGHASPAAEAASLAGAAETARMEDGFVKWGLSELYNLESRQANEMQRRMQDQHGYTEFRGCNEGEFDLCAFRNPRTGDVRAFKRPFVPIGDEEPFLVSSELTAASHAPDIVRSRILHPGVLQQHPLMSRAMLSAMDANPERTRRSGLASILAGRLTDPMSATMRSSAYDQLEPSILKKQPPSPFSKKGGKKRTGRARLRSRFRSRRR